MKQKNGFSAGAVFFLLLFSGGLLYSQQEPPRVAVYFFSTASDDPGINSLAETAGETLVLSLQLLDRYKVLSMDSPSPLDSESAFEELRQSFIDYAVYGSIEVLPEGGYSVRTFSWDSANKIETRHEEIIAESVFDLFDAIDQATTQAAREFTGIHVGYGSLVFDNPTKGLSYRIEVDGIPAGDNIPRRDVLYGDRKVSVYLLTDSEETGPYHLVSYLLDIEEGREYLIPIQVSPGLDLTDWNDGIFPPAPMEGSHVISSRPRNAAVYSGEEFLGRTPLVSDPVLLGPGNYLRIEGPHLIPLEAEFLQPNQLFELYPDPGDPAIRPALNSVWLGAATNVLLTAGQMAFMFLPGVEDGPPPWPMMLAASPRFGYALQDDLVTSGILSAGSALSLGLIMWASEMEYMEDDLSIALWQIPFWSFVLYDLIASPFSAAADNRATLRRIKEEGLPDTEKRSRPWISKPYTAGQIGGGAWFMAGAGFDALKDFFSFNIYAGISGDYFEPLKPIPSATAKTLIFPAAPFDVPIEPYIAALLHVGIKDLVFSGAAGPALGIEVPADLPRLPKMTLFFEVEYFYSPAGGFPMIGFGAKLK